jgi:hypothetical protein
MKGRSSSRSGERDPGSARPYYRRYGDVAQLVEHLLCKQGVVGSSPIVSTTSAWEGARVRTAARCAGALSVVVLLFGAEVFPAASARPMFDDRKEHYDYSAVQGYRSWIQAPRQTLEYRLFVQTSTGERYRVGRPGTVGIGSDLALDTALGDVLAFTHLGSAGGDADVSIWDLRERRFVETPEGVNSSTPEYGVEISGSRLLFGRDPRNNGNASQILLLDITSGHIRTLARVRRGWVTPDSLNGDFATYTVCNGTGCDVYRYRIPAHHPRAIPHPEDRPIYASTVTEDGSVYFARGVQGEGCGGGVSIERWTPDAHRTVREFSGRFDVAEMDALVDGGTTSLFVDRVECSRRLHHDIYRYEV